MPRNWSQTLLVSLASDGEVLFRSATHFWQSPYTRQRRMVLSADAVASESPSGENCTSSTSAWWPCVRSSRQFTLSPRELHAPPAATGDREQSRCGSGWTDPEAHDRRSQAASPLDGLDQRAFARSRVRRSDDEFLQRRVGLIGSLPLQQSRRLGLRALRHCARRDSGWSAGCISVAKIFAGAHWRAGGRRGAVWSSLESGAESRRRSRRHNFSLSPTTGHSHTNTVLTHFLQRQLRQWRVYKPRAQPHLSRLRAASAPRPDHVYEQASFSRQRQIASNSISTEIVYNAAKRLRV